MWRSIHRLGEVATYLEHSGVEPSHMLTLTLPPEVWERLPPDEAVARFKGARRRFLNALHYRLLSLGYSPSYLWWLEVQPRRGAPHIHLVVDLGGYLPEEDYRDWCDWVGAEWSRVLGVEAPYATRFEALRHRDFRYVKAYARKPNQKAFPFPARWGKSYGVAGEWADIVREAVRSPRSSWLLSPGELARVLEEVARELLRGLSRAASEAGEYLVATADEVVVWVRSLMPVYEVATAWARGERALDPEGVPSWRPFRTRVWWPERIGSPRREAFVAGIFLAVADALGP